MEEEDDFTIAWEILDLARTLYERRAEEDGEDVGRELGECLGLLGDVSLEGGEWCGLVSGERSGGPRRNEEGREES